MTRNGYFTPDNGADSFVLTDPLTRRGWQNYLFNETMFFQVNQFGQGMSRYWDSEGRDTTLFEADTRAVLVRNPDGSAWSPFVVPYGRVPDNYRCVYHPAFWEVAGEADGCRVACRACIPLEASLELWTVTVENPGSEPLARDIFLYFPVDLMGFSVRKYRFYSATTMFIRGFCEPDANAIWVKNGIPDLPHAMFNVFLASETPCASYTSDRESFLGVTGCLNAAKAVRDGACGNLDGYFGKTCLAMHHRVELAPGGTAVLRHITGPTRGAEHLRELAARHLNAAAFSREEELVQAARRRERDHSCLSAQARGLNSLANTWAKRQNRLGVLHRKGFRDVLQDSTGMLLYDVQRARAGIEEVLAVQKADGSGIRAWKPYIDAEPYSDGPYWLVYAVAEYLKETGDLTFLDKSFPYLDSPNPEPVWQHLVKAAAHLYADRGAYGFCRMRFADWNDGLDGVGPRGIGDSTMVTFGLVYALRELQAMAAAAGKSVPFDAAAAIADLTACLEKHAWTGEYFIRGYRDDGQPYGSPQNAHGSFYLNPQAWAVLAEAMPRDGWELLLRLTIERLGTERGLRLFAPCYPQFDPYIGRASAELPGVYENGAAYNHAAAFFLHALAKAGMADTAWECLKPMLPDSDANPSDRSGAEPFVLTNCIFGEEAQHRAGTSYFGWFTGTAAWVLRLVHNSFTGLTPELDGLHCRPELIPAGPGISRYARSFRNTRYVVEYTRTGRPAVLADGKAHDLSTPLPAKPGGTVKVEVCH